jgi:hypothetical protein
MMIRSSHALAMLRLAYVLLGAGLASIAAFWLAKHAILYFGLVLHIFFPEHYTFPGVVAAARSIRAWLCPPIAVASGVYAAFSCYQFGRVTRR